MKLKPASAPAPPVEQQNHIRACAMNVDYTVVGTWYYAGHAEIYHLLTGELIELGYVPNMDYFNEHLYNHVIQPIGMGRKGKRYGNL